MAKDYQQQHYQHALLWTSELVIYLRDYIDLWKYTEQLKTLSNCVAIAVKC